MSNFLITCLVCGAKDSKDRITCAPCEHFEKFTPREIDVYKFLTTSDLTYKEIAFKLKISSKTLSGHVWNLYGKTNTRNRAGLILRIPKPEARRRK